MKNVIKTILLLSLFVVFGCSSNDDNNTESDSSLFIGIWKPIKSVYVCSSGTDIENYTACEQTGRLTVRENGTWTETYFYEYNDICEDDGTSSGTWEIVNDKLIVTENGSGDIEITFFEIIGNTLKLGQYDDEICGEVDESAHYYGEYVKI
ncbi:lipocalin-like domain-containing protein [Aestuariivivens insulae]|uniref:lipocalin family protein n=1 Tax=Aestuariivivens insulae TaxID=1621988 RepID=UPI001F575C11|nr:lipocalin family protein [Aestuariivivens insulae]